MSTFETGTAARSKYHPDPVFHLIVSDGRGGWLTFCGGGPALRENTPTQRRCPRCLALARQDLVEQKVEDDEPSDLDWYLSRHVPRRIEEDA